MRYLSVCVEEEKMFLAIDLGFMADSEKKKLVAHIRHKASIKQCNEDVAISAIETIQANLKE